MKNSHGHSARTLKEIRELLQLGLSPTYCIIIPREASSSGQEEREFLGLNTESERLRLREETGDVL